MTAFRSTGRGLLLGAAAGLVLALLGLVVSDILILVGAILALTLGIIGVTFLVVQAKVIGDPEERAALLRHGQAGTATISAVHGTSGRVGGNPLLKLDLTLDAGVVTVREVVPIQHVHRLQVGQSLPVRVDGAKVAVDWEA